jgi:predicted lipid-binding transport protein (Tim44 family)
MSDGFQVIEIIFLAMLAGFIALRLVSVLGRRTGHEAEPMADPFKPQEPGPAQRTAQPQAAPAAAKPVDLPADVPASVQDQLRAVIAADPSFDPAGFARGAGAAYAMVLEAFWAGDEAALRPLVSDDVLALFTRAIAQRKADGITLENSLQHVDPPKIVAAEVDGGMLEVTVRYDAKLTAVSRNAAGEVVQGAAGSVMETHDVWTFSRHIKSPDPNWLLIATDEDDA